MNLTDTPQKPPPRCDCRQVGRPGCCRGGHRPGKHQAPTRGPAYTRSLELPQIGHRHRRWRWDATRALRAAVEARELSREAHATMLALLDHSDGRGQDCWPSLGTLGDELGGLAARTVGTHMAELKAKGWVAVKHRHRITANGIQGRSNLYRPLMPADAALAGRPAPTAARAERRHPRAEGSPVLDEVAPAAELIARWVAALEAMATTEVDTLAAKHLPALVAKRPGQARTSSLAVALANAEGPP
jgi:hypothetical protein